MNNDLISIIIPCYNSEITIEKCLVSVLGQNYTNLEVIVVNDGSTDGTFQILETFRKKDNRVKIISQQNSGVSRARNIGIESASGNFICFVDSDDWIEKDYCSVLYKNLIKSNAKLSIASYHTENNEQKEKFVQTRKNETVVYTRSEAIALLLEDDNIKSFPWAKLYRRQLFNGIKFPEHLEAFEDFFTMFKIFDKAKIVVVTDAKLYHYIADPKSLSHYLTPTRAYHFLLAISEAHGFLLKEEMENKVRFTIIKSQLKRVFMSLKRVLRNTHGGEMLQEKEDIRNKLRVFLRYNPFQIGLEYYFYLRFFINFPVFYTKFVKR